MVSEFTASDVTLLREMPAGAGFPRPARPGRHPSSTKPCPSSRTNTPRLSTCSRVPRIRYAGPATGPPEVAQQRAPLRHPGSGPPSKTVGPLQRPGRHRAVQHHLRRRPGCAVATRRRPVAGSGRRLDRDQCARLVVRRTQAPRFAALRRHRNRIQRPGLGPAAGDRHTGQAAATSTARCVTSPSGTFIWAAIRKVPLTQPLSPRPSGDVYDGFFPTSHAASLTPLALGEGLPRFEYVPMPPVGVPVIEVQSQSDVEGFGFDEFVNPGSCLGAASGQRRRRRPFPAIRNRGGAPRGQDRRLRRRRLELSVGGLCPCRAAQAISLGRGRHHSTDGAAHRTANRLEWAKWWPRRHVDRFGNARGGVPSPFLDVPIARYEAHSTPGPVCALAGREAALPYEVLANGMETCRPTSPNSPSASTRPSKRASCSKTTGPRS